MTSRIRTFTDAITARTLDCMTTAGLFQVPGSFTVGCNWWASHAGTYMWRDWRPEVVESDFARLKAAGMETIRLFPLWPDFQPLTQHYVYQVIPKEIRHGDAPLADRNGVDPVMLDRLVWTCHAAERHGLKLIIGLITGWMSGRMFAPEAIAHLDPITDPRSQVWQVRLVQAIVARLSNEPAVAAWDLGNECNCMGKAANAEAAAAWTALIANTIRAVDRSRPVVSGMHSLQVEAARGPWTIADQAEHCDVLTTHPYPLFTPHCAQDALDDQRTTHHATAETRLYADLGGKPGCAEELGTLGPVMGNNAAAAAFVRVNLFSLWANDCRGLLWWCGFDQSHLTHTPYDWNAIERELGLFDAAQAPRPLLQGFTELAATRDLLPGAILPPPHREAVCLLSRGQDAWSVAWSSWILAKQAGFDVRFAWIDDGIPAAARYLLPSVEGTDAVPRRLWLDLLQRVEAGADLLVTLGRGVLAPFESVLGATIALRRERRGADVAILTDGTRLPMTAGVEIQLVPTAGSEVLAHSACGAVAAVKIRRGRGTISTWAFPVEHQLTTTRGACDPGAPAMQRIYADWCAPLAAGRALARDGALWLALTEHDLDAQRRLVVAVNHGREAAVATLRLAPGWRVSRMLRGTAPQNGVLTVPAHDAAVLELLAG